MKIVDLEFVTGTGVISPFALSSAGDRTTGISTKQGAIAVARNILSGNLGVARITAMAANFTEAVHGDKPNRLPKHISAIVEKTRCEFRSSQYMPSREVGRGVPHYPVVELLLSPSQNQTLVASIGDHLTKFSLEAHASSLNRLKAVSNSLNDGLYSHVMRARLKSALEGLCSGRFPGHDPDVSIELIRNWAKCLVVRTAHERVQIFGDHSTRPYGDHFAGFKTNLLMGHTVMATVAAPAAAIQRFVAAARKGDFDDLDDDALLSRLVQLNVLPTGADGTAVMQLARKVLRALKCRNRNYSSQSILKILEEGTDAAAQLNRGDMRRAHLSQRGFAENRTGLSNSEGASYVALELLQALKQVDEVVDAILSGRALPDRKRPAIAKHSIAFASVILRSESQPDKNASTVRNKLEINSANGPDPDRKSGRIPMVSMLEKIRCPKLEKQCREAFAIDALVWFER